MISIYNALFFLIIGICNLYRDCDWTRILQTDLRGYSSSCKIRTIPVGAVVCGGSLKQQFTGRHVALLRHIILILSQPVFTLSP
jgi:hypothetical protein